MEEKTNIQNDINIPDSSYYYSGSDWLSNTPVAYALDIAIENYFKIVFEFPLTRMIYATNDFTFREREKKNGGNLNLPYLSYARIGYSECDREWWRNYQHLIGIMGYDSQIIAMGKQIKVFPIKVEYEGVVCFSQQKDLEYAYRKLAYECANETILYPMLEDDKGNTIKNIAIFNCDYEFNPSYNESEWLEKNKIFTLGMDFNCDTFLIMQDSSTISVAKSAELDFLVAKNYLNKDSTLLDTPAPRILLKEYFGD